MESLQIPNWVVKELESASIGSHGNCPRFLRGFDSYSKEISKFLVWITMIFVMHG